MQSHDSSMITFAVSFHFSLNVNKIITSAKTSIAEVTRNYSIIDNKIPLQITIELPLNKRRCVETYSADKKLLKLLSQRSSLHDKKSWSQATHLYNIFFCKPFQ